MAKCRPANGGKAIEWRLARLGIRPPAMSTLLVGLEGTPDETADSGDRCTPLLRGRLCVNLGRTLGQRWLETRFDLPYLRDELMDNHLLVDTLETATTWNRLFDLYRPSARPSIARCPQEGEPIVVFTHVSHLYRDGASLYFSLLGRQKRSDPIGQWWTIKQAAGDAIAAGRRDQPPSWSRAATTGRNGPRPCRAANARPIESDAGSRPA